MLKCNASSKSLTTEQSKPIPNAQVLQSSDDVHEVSGQDAAVIARIKNIREAMESIRLKIFIEKDNLARERLEASSMFLYQSTPTIQGNCVDVQSVYSLPTSWGSEITNQDYETCLVNYSYENNNFQPHLKNNYLFDTVVPDAYREHLQSVEKMCQKEFDKMQISISRPQSSDRRGCNKFFDATACTNNDKRLTKKDRGRSQNKYSRKSYCGDTHNYKQSSYVLPADLTTMDEHRRHYYYHYRDVTPQRKYLSRGHDSTKGERTKEYSGDSTETSCALWHPDGLYEVDDDDD